MIKSIVLVADAYPPSRTSAALQLGDLAVEFLREGIAITVITSDSDLQYGSFLEKIDGVSVLRLKTPKYKNIGNIRRVFGEVLLSLFMLRNFRNSTLKAMHWDAVVWYSPTIFLGPFIYYLKKKNSCPSYLILRDIFPAWALDLKIINKGLVYYFFRMVEKFQYSVADYIGVQAAGNLEYFKPYTAYNHKKIEVLQNWLTPRPPSKCSILISNLPIAKRKIFVYAGNMGIAQGMGDLLVFAESLLGRSDIGFLFVGRGSDMPALRARAEKRGLANTVFCDEIDPNEIPGLYAQCHVGLIALDSRHTTHNIPGKLISYLQSGLPVMAMANKGNDLHLIIEKYQVGRATSDRNLDNLRELAESIINDISLQDNQVSFRCKKVASEFFSSKVAVQQISKALNSLK